MLLGTPALSKPAELFPQLHALGAKNGWWEDKKEFMSTTGAVVGGMVEMSMPGDTPATEEEEKK